jgi:hypothetical protein
MQVGLEASLAREQIGQVPGCTVGMLGSAAGCWGSTTSVDGFGAEVAAGAETGGTEGEVCVSTGPTSRTSCSLSLSVSESTWSASGGFWSWLELAVVAVC